MTLFWSDYDANTERRGQRTVTRIIRDSPSRITRNITRNGKYQSRKDERSASNQGEQNSQPNESQGKDVGK